MHSIQIHKPSRTIVFVSMVFIFVGLSGMGLAIFVSREGNYVAAIAALALTAPWGLIGGYMAGHCERIHVNSRGRVIVREERLFGRRWTWDEICIAPSARLCLRKMAETEHSLNSGPFTVILFAVLVINGGKSHILADRCNERGAREIANELAVRLALPVDVADALPNATLRDQSVSHKRLVVLVVLLLILVFVVTTDHA